MTIEAPAHRGTRQPLDPIAANSLDAISSLLWPGGPARVTRWPGRTRPGARALWVVPGPARPRLLLPAGVRAAAVMMGRHSASGRPSLARSAVAAGVRSGALALLPVPRLVVAVAQSVDEHLSEVLGGPVTVGVLLGPPRANGKPVLQVFDADGRTVAFVKVAHNSLTRRLVDREAAALRRLAAARLTELQVPNLIHAGEFRGARILVLGPLASSQQHRDGRPEMPLAAMADLATCVGTTTARLADSPFATRLGTAVASLPDTAEARRLRRQWAGLLAAQGAAEMTFGSWHGDWAAWNMGLHEGAVQVWDWERFDDCVPVGFDPVHFQVQHLLAAETTVAAAAQALRDTASALLVRLGAEPDQAALTAALYLTEIAARYLLDGGSTPSAALIARRGWILDTLDALVPDLSKGNGTP